MLSFSPTPVPHLPPPFLLYPPLSLPPSTANTNDTSYLAALTASGADRWYLFTAVTGEKLLLEARGGARNWDTFVYWQEAAVSKTRRSG